MESDCLNILCLIINESIKCVLKGILFGFLELINKLSFLDEEEQDLANSRSNPFVDSDRSELNPFGDTDIEGI